MSLGCWELGYAIVFSQGIFLLNDELWSSGGVANTKMGSSSASKQTCKIFILWHYWTFG